MTNPNSADAPNVTIHFKEYSSSPVVYPSLEKVLELASKEVEKVH